MDAPDVSNSIGLNGWRGEIRVLGAGASSGRIEIDDPVHGLEGGVIDIAGTWAGVMELAHIQAFAPPSWPASDPVITINKLSGTIHALSDLVGELTIDGPGTSSGDILADGNILADVLVSGTFGGDICGANLVPGGPLPSNIVICGFNLNGTICGSPPVPIGVYGDVTPPGGNDIVNLDDILYVLSCFSNIGAFPNGDIAPCGGNDICNLDDILAILGAFSGNPACGVTCK